MFLLRLLAILLLVLTGVYLCLWMFFRAGARDRLAARWAEERPPLPEHRFVQLGLAEYDRTLRPRLVAGVYGLPLLVAVVAVAYPSFA